MARLAQGFWSCGVLGSNSTRLEKLGNQLSERWALLGSGLSGLAFLTQLETELALVQPSKRPTVTVFPGLVPPAPPSVGAKAAVTGKQVNGVDPFFIVDRLTVKSRLAKRLAGSNSIGGWGQIWGATWCPPTEQSLQDWPEAIAQKLALFFEKAESAFDIVGTPLHRKKSQTGTVRVSLGFLDPQTITSPGVSETRGERTISIRPSNLFIAPFADDQSSGCNQCGQCLLGCPSNHILNPAVRFELIVKSPSLPLEVRPGVIVQELQELNDFVSIKTVSLSGDQEWHEFDRVFVGLGALQTAVIMLRTESIKDPVILGEAAMIAVPFIRKKFQRTDTVESRISLCDAFFLSSETSPNLTADADRFAQLYGSSAALIESVWALRILKRLLPAKAADLLLSRIGVAMYFEHSDSSRQIELTRQKGEILIRPGRRPRNPPMFTKFLKEIRSFGILPLPLIKRRAPTGHSYHLGGSFPLVDPEPPESRSSNWSDALGRPNHLDRVHLIDSSVLPRVTSTPTAGVTMANAMRLCSAVVAELLKLGGTQSKTQLL
jgi:ferredoxin